MQGLLQLVLEALSPHLVVVLVRLNELGLIHKRLARLTRQPVGEASGPSDVGIDAGDVGRVNRGVGQGGVHHIEATV